MDEVSSDVQEKSPAGQLVKNFISLVTENQDAGDLVQQREEVDQVLDIQGMKMTVNRE